MRGTLANGMATAFKSLYWQAFFPYIHRFAVLHRESDIKGLCKEKLNMVNETLVHGGLQLDTKIPSGMLLTQNKRFTAWSLIFAYQKYHDVTTNKPTKVAVQ